MAENKIISLTIRAIERDLESNPEGRGGIISHNPARAGVGQSATPGENFLADWRELESAFTSAQARSERAEALLGAVIQIVLSDNSSTADKVIRVLAVKASA